MDLSELTESAAMAPGRARLPWSDPGFAQRMLAEHLDETHDRASRRPQTIDSHVDWLSRQSLTSRPSVLDLGCGPGLYCERLAALGHRCRGVDISPAAIAYATERARDVGLSCEYVLSDFSTADLAGPHDLVFCLFGEISTFEIDDVRQLLARIAAALAPAGRVVIERSTLAGVRSIGNQADGWYRSDRGLFADGPHLVVHESRWFESEAAAVERWWVLESGATKPARYETTTWWHGAAFDRAIADAGLAIDQQFGDLTGSRHDADAEFDVVVLRGVRSGSWRP